MADLRITELPLATAPSGVELAEIVQGGVNKKIAIQDLADLAADQHFKGVYASEAALNIAVPVAVAGDYAFVDAGPGQDVTMFLWDTDDVAWVAGGSGGVVPDASETVKGIVEIATQAEMNTGTDDLRTVTPLKATTRILISTFAASGTDTYTVTVPGLTAYVTGQTFDVTFPNTNTTIATLNVNGLGAKSIKKNFNVPLTSGDILPSGAYRIYYNGTDMQLVNVQLIRREYNVEAYGARHDYRTVSDANITSGTATLTSATAAFTTLDTGKSFRVFGAGAAGVDLLTTGTFVNSTTITLAVNASTTIAAKQIQWGTDDTPWIRAAIGEAVTRGGGTVYLPNGIYFLPGDLITTVDGINPNCQIYIPLTSLSETKTTIKIVGESAIMWPSGPFAAQNLPAKGVILKSVITGSGTTPSVIGSSFAFDGAVDGNATSVIFENICIMVKSTQGTTHIAPTMSGGKLYNLGAKQLYNCIATTESDPTESILPVAVTYGWWLDQQGHTDVHSVYSNVTAANFYYGFRREEHGMGIGLNAYTCLHAIAISGNPAGGSHPVLSAYVTNNWCKYGITFLENKIIDITYYSERWPGSAGAARWYDFTADIFFPATKAVNGVITGTSTQAFSGAGAQVVVSGAFTGNLSIKDIIESPTFVNSSTTFGVTSTGSDVIQAISSTTLGRAGFYAKNTAAGAQATLYMENNRGSFASYGGFLYGGSTNSIGNMFGVSRADKLNIIADGASNLGLGVGTLVAQPFILGTNNTNRVAISGAGSLNLERTVTAGGTTGAQTINKMSGVVNMAAGQSTLVVTNSLAATTSTVIAIPQGVDTTPKFCVVTRAAGSFTITLSAVAVAELPIAFWVFN